MSQGFGKKTWNLLKIKSSPPWDKFENMSLVIFGYLKKKFSNILLEIQGLIFLQTSLLVAAWAE